ncbi:MAG: hypothetical protein WCQ86_00780 [Bacteroidaceae bacterium]
MKRKTILSLMSLALCTFAATAQTWKLTDMTSTEFENGGNSQFSFAEYKLETGTYSNFTIFNDSGRVNWFDCSVPERFAGETLGEPSANNPNDGKNDYYAVLRKSWMDEFVKGRDNRAPSWTFISEDFQVYPNCYANSAIVFTAPSEGYYKVQSSIIRQDWLVNDSLIAKFRFREQGTTTVPTTATVGKDYPYGQGGELYDLPGEQSAAGNIYQVHKRVPATGEFYIYLKAGDQITAEADASHFYGTKFTDRENNWPRNGWARSKWLQFDVTKLDETPTDYVNPYAVNIEFNQKLIDLIYAFYELKDNKVGYGIGEYNQESIDAFFEVNKDLLDLSDAEVMELTAIQAQAFYEKLYSALEAFKLTANKVDYTLAENTILFQVASDPFWGPIFEKQFTKTEDATRANPWNFVKYSKGTGLYSNFVGDGTTIYGDWLYKGAVTKTDCWHDAENNWCWMAKDGTVSCGTYGASATGPAFVYTAISDGIYKVNSSIKRDVAKSRAWYMWETFRFSEGGITVAETVVPASSYMFRKEYGKNGDGTVVNAEYYINMKAGDAFSIDITTADDAINSGNTATYFSNLPVIKLSDEEAATLQGTPDNYYNAYGAADFSKFDEIISETMSAVQEITASDALGVGNYSQAKIDAFLATASEMNDKRDAGGLTQADANIMATELQSTYDQFVANYNVAYMTPTTLPDGPYMIMQNNAYLTAKAGERLVGGRNANCAPYLSEAYNFNEDGLKTNQVWYIKHFKPTGEITDGEGNVTTVDLADPTPAYFIYSVYEGETWNTFTDLDELANSIYLDDYGLQRLNGVNSNALSGKPTVVSDSLYHRHNFISDGTAYAIYTPKSDCSMTFSTNSSNYTNYVSASKVYAFTLIPWTADYTAIETVGADETQQIIAYGTANAVELKSNVETSAIVYNATGSEVAKVQLSSTPVQLSLGAGFYIVKAANGATAKVLVK